MLEKKWEECLNNAFKFAHENNHEFVTTEHVLLSILTNQDTLNVLLACEVNVDILEAELKEFISKNCPEKKDDAIEIQPTLSFQRVIQRAVFHVQSSGTGEVTGANILVASENDVLYFCVTNLLHEYETSSNSFFILVVFND